MGQITSLITDFGGVLTTSIFESFKAFCIDHSIEPEVLRVVFAEMIAEGDANLLFRLERGELEHEEFDRLFAEQLSKRSGVQVDHVDLKARMFFQVRPAPEIVNAIDSIHKAGFATALLSNSWGPGGYPREIFEDMFDAVVISGEVGLRKPDPEIYLMTAKMIDRDPAECVFIDDIKVNVEGAEAVGMTGLHHREAKETLEELAKLFDVPFDHS
ncbi:MAG: HAD family phosphatase [Actinobacteria bacterium]|nr:HAD family phosphatase [Actinomycetota bacterium]